MSDRGVLVTGASRGIGRATALAFARLGDRVAVHHRDSEELAAQLVAELPGTGHLTVGGDLADPEIAKAVVDLAVAGLGRVDVLVNNAGTSILHDLTQMDFEEWRAAFDRTIAVNLAGAAYVSYFVARQMMGAGGRIVNVSSRGAFRGEPGQPGYGASKAGLNAFGQSLALALGGYGIAVATVAPGWVATDMSNEELKRPRGGAILEQSPFHRIAEPEEVAAAIVFLASPEATFTSGAILDVNGASYLRS
ncbi:MAG TPA: SDR family oxidoreductase [Candidatus Dormibacteraeota bacterium]|nr:SDR family oxidoreductase [Candidatus Dormibacteraeota bacterium]